MRSVLWLVLAVLVTCSGVAEETPQPSVAASLADEPAVDVSTLVEMVKQRPFTFTERQPLIGASFSGETVRLSTTRLEPLTPNTLIKYFDDWHFAARLQLLMDYASWKLGQEQPRTYGGPRAEKERQLDRKADLRIATLVHEAGYERAWKPFIAVYAEFRREITEKALKYRSETGDVDPINMMLTIEIDKLARPKLEGVIENFPMDPQVVAHEMLRLLEMTRKMLGVSGPETLDDHLFHACGTGSDSTIVANPGHPLASAFFAAYQADDDDTVARQIKSSHSELVSAYRLWSSENPTAYTKDQLDHVRELTERFHLVGQIKGYRDAADMPDGRPKQ